MAYQHNKVFQCEVIRLSYDFNSHSGFAEFAENNCCDMDGAIQVFTAIDPEVKLIQTYSGSKKDTRYKKIDAQWYAL